MFYDVELRFLQSVFKRCRVRTFFIHPGEQLGELVSLDMYRRLGVENVYEQIVFQIAQILKANTIYRLVDRFGCRYIFFELPGEEPRSVLVIGPYLQESMNQRQMLERMEEIGIPPQNRLLAEDFYAAVPVLPEDSSAFALIDAFAERIWGADAYNSIDVNHEILNAAPPEVSDVEDTQEVMRATEQRYAYENELMRAVSMGQTHKAEMMLASVSLQTIANRFPDALRNIRNYCIIINTLFRKAAEHGGVHPMYLENLSTMYARKIEQQTSVAAAQRMMIEMAHAYCRLVKRFSTKEYSLPVQKAILQIDTDLSAELSLKALAERQNVNASYLSALFKKETGQTVTDYVNQRRIRYAIHLLSTTKLQIKTVAQHCGIQDINYFSKIFKKYTLSTPKEYRKNILAQIDSRKET